MRASARPVDMGKHRARSAVYTRMARCRRPVGGQGAVPDRRRRVWALRPVYSAAALMSMLMTTRGAQETGMDVVEDIGTRGQQGPRMMTREHSRLPGAHRGVLTGHHWHMCLVPHWTLLPSGVLLSRRVPGVTGPTWEKRRGESRVPSADAC